jgi:hypothetical protein
MPQLLAHALAVRALDKRVPRRAPSSLCTASRDRVDRRWCIPNPYRTPYGSRLAWAWHSAHLGWETGDSPHSHTASRPTVAAGWNPHPRGQSIFGTVTAPFSDCAGARTAWCDPLPPQARILGTQTNSRTACNSAPAQASDGAFRRAAYSASLPSEEYRHILGRVVRHGKIHSRGTLFGLITGQLRAFN